MNRITDQQLSLIHSLRCEKFFASEDNLRLVASFENNLNPNMAKYLHDADEMDEPDTEIYVVKSVENEILFYFSLKCGLIFTPLLTQDEIDKYMPMAELFNGEEWRLNNDVTMFQVENHMTEAELVKFFRGIPARVKEQKKRKINDAKYGEPSPVIGVKDSFPAVELAHFCKNTEARFPWDADLVNKHTIGEVVFWFKIMPIVQEIPKYAGCKFMYLFAADEEPNGDLVKYYADAFGMDANSSYGSVVSNYDKQCKFMCQSLRALNKMQADFKDNFNAPKLQE